MLIVAPWKTAFWDRNFFLERLPVFESLLSSVFVRGAVSGIGALTTLAEIANDATLRRHYPALAAAAAHAATPQIRNAATIGGNLLQRPRCWYFRNEEFHCLKKGGPRCFAVEGENQYHAIFGDAPCHIVHPSSLAVPILAYG